MKTSSFARWTVAALALMLAGTVGAAPEAQAPRTPASAGSSDVLMMAQQMPSFKGGTLAGYQKWVSFKARAAVRTQGVKDACRADVLFVVDTEGRVTDIEVKSASSQAFADEVVRVMERSPKWRAGRQNGEPVKVRLLMTVTADI